MHPIDQIRQYNYNGVLINGDNGATAYGIGHATITVYPRGLAKIDFTARITTAGTSGSSYRVGLNRNFLTSAVGAVITPVTGGRISFFRAGMYDKEINGYGAFGQPTDEFWMLSRIYMTDSSFGNWLDAVYQVDDIITGTVYGIIQ